MRIRVWGHHIPVRGMGMSRAPNLLGSYVAAALALPPPQPLVGGKKAAAMVMSAAASSAQAVLDEVGDAKAVQQYTP